MELRKEKTETINPIMRADSATGFSMVQIAMGNWRRSLTRGCRSRPLVIGAEDWQADVAPSSALWKAESDPHDQLDFFTPFMLHRPRPQLVLYVGVIATVHFMLLPVIAMLLLGTAQTRSIL